MFPPKSFGGNETISEKSPFSDSKTASSSCAFCDHLFVRRSDRQMIVQPKHFITGRLECPRNLLRNALVREKRDLHFPATTSKSAKSRAYCKHAETSSAAMSGNSRRISEVLRPAAKYPNINAAGIRVPAMHGLPFRIDGSLTIRCCHS